MWGAALTRRDEKRARPGSSDERSELETWRLLIKCISKVITQKQKTSAYRRWFLIHQPLQIREPPAPLFEDIAEK